MTQIPDDEADSISLDDIACELGTDKSTRSSLPRAEGYDARPEQGHGYTIYYEHYLRHLRRTTINLLEIGVLDGRSLATWSRYFRLARIYGLDIDPACRRFEEDRIKIFIGSQAEASVLSNIREQVPEGFDVIIDDGSHYIRHIIASFSELFRHVKPGGYYIIEDIHIGAWLDWGRVALNKGMDMERDPAGNNPDEMVRFLRSIRERRDVAEATVHLKKICFIRKTSTGAAERFTGERGDRLEDLFPPIRKATLIQKIARRVFGPL